MSKRQVSNATAWAKLLLNNVYGCWFACLPAFVQVSAHKEAGLHCAHTVLLRMRAAECLQTPDESFYRVLLHLCLVYDKPAVAKRVFQFAQMCAGDNQQQITAITYGLYNKAVLEGTWLDSARSG